MKRLILIFATLGLSELVPKLVPKKYKAHLGKRVSGIVLSFMGVSIFIDSNYNDWTTLVLLPLIGLLLAFIPEKVMEFVDSKLCGVNEKNYPEYFAELREKKLQEEKGSTG